MEKRSSKQAILLVIVMIVFFISVIGFAFAFFTYQRTSGTKSTINAGKLELGYIEETNGISLQNAMPVNDLRAINTADENAYFDFYVTYSVPSSSFIRYEIDIEDITESTLEGQEEITKLPSSRVKVALENRSVALPDDPFLVSPTYFSSIELIPATGGKKGYKLFEKTISGEEVDYYRLYMWLPEVDSEGTAIPMIDVDGVEGIAKRAFSVRINVQALAQVKE